MTDLTYMVSDYEQLQTRRELENIKQVLDRYGIADADGLQRVLGRYKRLDRLIRGVRAAEGAEPCPR